MSSYRLHAAAALRRVWSDFKLDLSLTINLTQTVDKQVKRTWFLLFVCQMTYQYMDDLLWFQTPQGFHSLPLTGEVLGGTRVHGVLF